MDDFEKQVNETVDELFKEAEQKHTDVLREYKKSLDEVRNIVAVIFTKYAVDGKLTYADLVKYNRLNTVIDHVKSELKNLGSLENKEVNKNLGDVFQESYYRHAFMLESGMSIGIDFTLLKPEFVKEVVGFNWSGVPFSERIWANQDQMLRNLRTELTQGVISGEDWTKVSRRFAKVFDTSAYNSKRLFVTESARVISSAQSKIYEDSGVVDQIMWLSTLDSSTSKICQSRDGKKWSINEDYPKPPAHPNCRSTLLPLIDGHEVKKRKDNQTKDIIPFQNYKEWYKNRVN